MLGDPEGTFSSMITETNGKEKRVIGIRTEDGRRHFADLVIVAGERKTCATDCMTRD